MASRSTDLVELSPNPELASARTALKVVRNQDKTVGRVRTGLISAGRFEIQAPTALLDLGVAEMQRLAQQIEANLDSAIPDVLPEVDNTNFGFSKESSCSHFS